MAEMLVGNAGKQRLFAMIVDNLLATILGLAVAANVPGLSGLGRGVVLVAIYLAYFFVPEAIWSRTLGKLACGLIVRRTDGRRAGWLEAAARTLLRIIEVNPLLLGAFPGGLAVVFSKRKQRMGDMLADTVVVPSRMRAADD